jgi:lysophospholipid acyltransferase (LPLAT)-like uncharacterized protein
LKILRELGRRLGPGLGRWYLELVFLTSRMEFHGFEHLQGLSESKRPLIAAFWHGRLALAAGVRREKPVHVMISRHADGEIIARIARAFNKPSVRGSTTRGGKQAFRELAELVKRGQDAAVTPDGPKGPRYVCQPGIVALAKIAKAPILPMSCSANRNRRIRSWDRFMVPLPFSKIVIAFAAPIEIPENCGEDELERKRVQLEETLIRLTREADEACAVQPD